MFAALLKLWDEDGVASMQPVAFPHLAGGLAGGAFDPSVDTPINQMRLLDALLRRRTEDGSITRDVA